MHAMGQHMWLSCACCMFQVCGQGPATTPEKLAGALYEGLPNSQAETLQGMFKACSYSTAEFSQQIGGMIIPVTVPIPCQGRTPWNAPFDSSTCPFTGEQQPGDICTS